MDLLLGRKACLHALEEAEELARGGGTALISLIGRSGSGRTRLLEEFESILTRDGFETARVAAFEATETEPGYVASKLPERGALLIDDAQWVDATSLALLRSRIAKSERGLIVVLAHAPIPGYLRFAHESLVETVNRHGRAWLLTLGLLDVQDLTEVVNEDLARDVVEMSGGLAADVAATLDAWMTAGAIRREGRRLIATGARLPQAVTLAERVDRLGREERKFVEVAAISRQPLPLSISAAVLGITEDSALEIGERLAAQGLLHQSAEGFIGEKRLARHLGQVRRASLAGNLGDALAGMGMADRNPGLVGGYYLEATRWGDALPLLAQAGLDHSALGHHVEAYPLVDGALTALERSGHEDPVLEGRLRLARASGYRLAGLSNAAAEDLDVAIAKLSGVDRIHALGYAGQVADDRQRPQHAERFLAEGLLEAIAANELGMLGSLMTLHARTLARLGFAREADAEMAKALAVLASSGTSEQQQRGRYNEAWVAFDRGWARKAEPGFARLVDEAGDSGVVLADRLAWWSRALFMSGRPDQALETRTKSIQHADLDAGPVFLAHMALAEGAIRFRVWDEALEAAEETLALVLQQLPAWENSARYLRARALLGAGRIDEADAEADAASESCPPGVDGRRWWLRIRVLQLEIAVAKGDAWPSDEAFDLTDEILQSEWYLTAARLQVLRAKVERDPSLATEAMALAMELGVADVAAEAAEIGGLWNRPEAAAVSASVKTMAAHVPDSWRSGWESSPFIKSALDQPDIDEETYQSAAERLTQQLDQALEEAGLGAEGRFISPAQRRARGLKRRRRPFRWTPVRVAAAVVVVAALGLGGGFLAKALTPASPATTIVMSNPSTIPTTTTLPEIWDRELGPPPKDVVTGQWSFGGDTDDQSELNLNTGSSGRTGVRKADGYYWKYATGGRLESSPVVFGENVIVASEDGSLYGFAMASGAPPLWTEDSSNGALVASPSLAFFASGNSLFQSAMRVYYGSTDGLLRIRDAGNPTAQVLHVPEEGGFDGEIVSSPVVVGDTVYLGTAAGTLYAVSTSDPFPELWSVDLGSPILATPAAAGGTLYVGTEGGVLWSVDEKTGAATECYDTKDTIVSPPVIAGDIVLIPARDSQNLYAVQVGSCNLVEGIFLYQKVTSSPAYADGVLYAANGSLVQAYDLQSRDMVWQYPNLDSGSHLGGRAGWPVVAGGVLYFTTDESYVYAVDIETHELLWRYHLDGRVVSRPAVMNGAVVVGDLSGTIVAIGCENPPDCK